MYSLVLCVYITAATRFCGSRPTCTYEWAYHYYCRHYSFESSARKSEFARIFAPLSTAMQSYLRIYLTCAENRARDDATAAVTGRFQVGEENGENASRNKKHEKSVVRFTRRAVVGTVSVDPRAIGRRTNRFGNPTKSSCDIGFVSVWLSRQTAQHVTV